MKNKIAFITGATRGIGQAIALNLGLEGAKIVGSATTKDGAKNITKMLKEKGIDGVGIVLDVSKDEQISSVIDTINTTFGSIDILVNNAGITRDNLLIRMNIEQWLDVIDTNLSSVYKMSKAVLRTMMKNRYGRIISITSVVGLTGNAGQTNYSASKAGIIGFSKSLAKEVGSRGITVNTIAPGFIKTDMTDQLPDEQKELLAKQIPMQRLGIPEEIADAVLFLASDKASYITGQTLHVNGGMYGG